MIMHDSKTMKNTPCISHYNNFYYTTHNLFIFMNNRIIIGIAAVILIPAAAWYFALDAQEKEESVSSKSVKKIAITNNVIKNDMHQITLQTNKGAITFETYAADAPKTVENFVTLAKKEYYDGLIFHRVIKGFMIQGGDPKGNGTGGPGYTFEDELDPTTPSYQQGYKKGVVAMANAGPNTNGSQFFIMLEDNPLPNNYTIFGHVVQGQEVVDAIGKVATDGNDRPKENVTIQKVIVEEVK